MLPQSQSPVVDFCLNCQLSLFTQKKVQIQNLKLFLKMAFRKSMKTTDTLSHNSKGPHNCPNCQCYNINSMNSDRHNLYLSSQFNQTINSDAMTITFAPHRFTQTQQISNNIDRLTYSPSHGNITFSYLNPPKIRKNRSSGAKFCTKTYKHQCFPHFNEHQYVTNPIRKFVRPIQKHIQPLEIFTNQETPQKHKILKMNKTRSGKQLGIQSNHNIQTNQSLNLKQSSNQQSQKNLKNPQNYPNPNSPINFFKPKITQPITITNRDVFQINSQQIELPPLTQILNKHDYLRDVPLVQTGHYLLPAQIIQQSNKSYKIDPKTNYNKKYSTLNSIDINQQCKWQQNWKEKSYKLNCSSDKQTSLKNLKEYSSQQQHKNINNYDYIDRVMALNISEQLQLHYDYYYLPEESDKSISFSVEL